MNILPTLRLYCRVKPWLQTGHQTLLFLTLPAELELVFSICCCCCCIGLLAICVLLALASTRATAAFTSEGCAVAKWFPRTAASWKTSLQM